MVAILCNRGMRATAATATTTATTTTTTTVVVVVVVVVVVGVSAVGSDPVQQWHESAALGQDVGDRRL